MTRPVAALCINAEVGGQPGREIRVERRAGSCRSAPGWPAAVARQCSTRLAGLSYPGLHDHHVHLRALVAARQSVDALAQRIPAAFDRIISRGGSGRWVLGPGCGSPAGSRRQPDTWTGTGWTS